MEDAACCIEGCSKPVHVRLRQLCRSHYEMWQKRGTTKPAPVRQRAMCIVEGCTALAVGGRLCRLHYGRQWRGEDIGGLERLRTGPKAQPPEPCRAEGCERNRETADYCLMHYKRWKRTGDPLGSTRDSPRPSRWSEEGFRARVRRGDQDECWEWDGPRDSDGYGKTTKNGKSVKAHRVAWELTNGPIVPGLLVLHSCDNPPCCNPAHLWIGTHRDNQRDRRSKGR